MCPAGESMTAGTVGSCSPGVLSKARLKVNSCAFSSKALLPNNNLPKGHHYQGPSVQGEEAVESMSHPKHGVYTVQSSDKLKMLQLILKNTLGQKTPV